jgi:hypothetical protein
MVRWGFLAEDENESIRVPIGSPWPGLRGKSPSLAMCPRQQSDVSNMAIVANLSHYSTRKSTQRIFKLAIPSNANNAELIQKRTTIFVSGSPRKTK